jgi:hypothetical protein
MSNLGDSLAERKESVKAFIELWRSELEQEYNRLVAYELLLKEGSDEVSEEFVAFRRADYECHKREVEEQIACLLDESYSHDEQIVAHCADVNEDAAVLDHGVDNELDAGEVPFLFNVSSLADPAIANSRVPISIPRSSLPVVVVNNHADS